MFAKCFEDGKFCKRAKCYHLMFSSNGRQICNQTLSSSKSNTSFLPAQWRHRHTFMTLWNCLCSKNMMSQSKKLLFLCRRWTVIGENLSQYLKIKHYFAHEISQYHHLKLIIQTFILKHVCKVFLGSEAVLFQVTTKDQEIRDLGFIAHFISDLLCDLAQVICIQFLHLKPCRNPTPNTHLSKTPLQSVGMAAGLNAASGP